MCGYAQTLCHMCVYVGLQGVWLEKYRLFYVVFALCFTVSLVGGWLNESFGRRLRYQKQRFGLGVTEGRQEEKENPTCTCGFWIPGAHYCTVMSVSPPCYLQYVVWNLSRYTLDRRGLKVIIQSISDRATCALFYFI